MANCTHCGFESQEDFRFCPSCGSQYVGAEADQVDPMIGRTLGDKYRVLEQIGAGSMGTVYRAEHVALQKPVAIKVLRRDLDVGPDALRRFQREGIAAGQINHPNVIQIFDFDRTEDGAFFLAMEFVDGWNLKTWLAERGPIPPEQAVDLGCQLVATLVEAHRHGVIHRDLKPENVMVAASAAGAPSLKVLDFGLSKLVHRSVELSQATIPGRVLGTPMYMAPEQWRGGDVDHRADIYAAALILYEMIAGKPPFKASDVTEVMFQTTSSPPPSLLESELSVPIPGDLDDVVQRGLAKDPGERFQSAGEMLEALEQVRFDRLVQSRRRRSGSAAGRRPPAAARAGVPRAAIIGGAVVILTALGLWLVLGSRGAGAEHSGGLLSSATTLSAEQRRYVDLLRDAGARLREGDTAAALGAVEQAISMGVADAESFVVRARIRGRRGEIAGARADYEKALEMLPGYPAAAAGIGWLEFDRGDLAAARQRFDAVLERSAEAPDALAGRGAVLAASGEATEAEAVLDRAAGTHPDNALVQLWRGRVKLQRGNAQGALLAFERARTADGSLLAAIEGMADAHRQRGNAESAAREYRKALDLEPGAVALRRKLVEVLVETEQFEEAGRALAATANRGDDAELSTLMGLVEQGRGDLDAAVDALETALSLDSNDQARVLALLANLEVQRGNFRRAVAHSKVSASIDDTRAAVYSAWGVALCQLGEYPAAAEKLERAAELDPQDPYVRYCLGVVYMDYLGDTDRARAALETYVELGGEEPRVEAWLRRLGGGD